MVLPTSLLYFSKSITGSLTSLYHNWQEMVQLIFNMGRSRNFNGSKYFSTGVDTLACKIEGCDYKYKPKNGSEVHASPLIGQVIAFQMKTFKLLNYTFKLTFLNF